MYAYITYKREDTRLATAFRSDLNVIPFHVYHTRETEKRGDRELRGRGSASGLCTLGLVPSAGAS